MSLVLRVHGVDHEKPVLFLDGKKVRYTLETDQIYSYHLSSEKDISHIDLFQSNIFNTKYWWLYMFNPFVYLGFIKKYHYSVGTDDGTEGYDGTFTRISFDVATTEYESIHIYMNRAECEGNYYYTYEIQNPCKSIKNITIPAAENQYIKRWRIAHIVPTLIFWTAVFAASVSIIIRDAMQAHWSYGIIFSIIAILALFFQVRRILKAKSNSERHQEEGNSQKLL